MAAILRFGFQIDSLNVMVLILGKVDFWLDFVTDINVK